MTTGAAALSFNEIEALGTKAARGAGLGWGQAEDLGRSVRWLAAHGFDWSEPLLTLLDDGAASVRVSELMQGVDRASSARPGDTWTVMDTAGGLVVPMLAASIYGRDVALDLRGTDGAMALRSDGTAQTGSPMASPDLGNPIAIEATRDGLQRPHAIESKPRPLPLSSFALARLTAYADRTAVPASEKSRMRGAGSTLSDND